MEGNITRIPRLSDSVELSAAFHLFLVVTILIVFSNGCVVIAYLKSNYKLNYTKKVILYLACTDCISGVIMAITAIMSRVITVIASNNVENVKISCAISYGSVQCCACISHLLVAFANFERYIAICKQHLYQRVITKRNFNVITLVCWILPISITLISFLQTFNENDVRFEGCDYAFVLPYWNYIFFSFVVLLMMGLSLFLYINVLIKARGVHQRIKLQVEDNMEYRIRNKLILRSIRKGEIIGFITVALIICWMPFSITSMMIGVGWRTIPDVVKKTAFSLTALGGVINPFVYAYQRKDIRQTAIKMFCCCINRTVMPIAHQVSTNTNPNAENPASPARRDDRNNEVKLEDLEEGDNIVNEQLTCNNSQGHLDRESNL